VSVQKSKGASSGAPDSETAIEAMIHFITAMFFLFAGLVALVWNSGRLADGQFSDPRVVGGLHFITLGWLSLSIFGALRVFTGVALGTQGYNKKLVPWIRSIWSLGAVLFPMGLILQKPLLIMSGAPLIGVALLLFTIHIVPALIMSERSGFTKWFLFIGIISLWGTWLLGLTAALIRAGIFVTPPEGYFFAHILLAVFGWIGSCVLGVGSHLIPMFALSKVTRQWPIKAALALWAFIPLCGVLGAFYTEPFLTIGWSIAGFGSLLWIIQVAHYFKGRLRKEAEPGLMLAGGSTILLGLSWFYIFFQEASISFVGLLIIGWLTLFTLGIYHRVIPFLAWYARFARNIGKGVTPKVQDLIDWKLGMMTTGFSLAGAIIWSIGLFTHLSSLTYTGSASILIAALISLGQLRTLIGTKEKNHVSADKRTDNVELKTSH